MTFNEIMVLLEKLGDEQTKKTLMRHGAKEPFYGVKVADLKTILKKTKKNHELSLQLFNTGNSDAMYLAGLMADETKITKEDLENWVEKAYWSYLNEYAVPWVTSETKYGFELGLKWIDSENENIAAAGWATLSSCAAISNDEDLNINTYSKLLDRISDEIHQAPNRVRRTMNSFVIAIGTYIKDLTEKSKAIATIIGVVTVDMSGTACKVPYAPDYIQKSVNAGKIGVKRKSARC
ncbi:MAG: DNA alkylation repair protein [Saprospiraceae bacterium]|jgi:3-methyladenine DNA glycosylase AlkD|nr:DNA alkylation repair protein [Saprospiraceae bacterium]